MQKWNEAYKEETEVVARERMGYTANRLDHVKVFFDKLSIAFLLAGFAGLIAVPFTTFTLVQATCLFVISYVVSPSDGDRYESTLKGIAQDLANIRIHTAITSKAKERIRWSGSDEA